MKETLEKTLEKMPGISKPFFRFVTVLLTTVLCLRGRMNFRNMSRYSDLSEKTFSRNFRKDFDFLLFNRTVIEEVVITPATRVAAMDCTFVPKSGDRTYGVDWFRNGSADRNEKGLELSVMAVVDVDRRTAYTLSAMQTPPSKTPKFSRRLRKAEYRELEKCYLFRPHSEMTRTNFYLGQLRTARGMLPEDIRYLVVDGYYSKEKFVTGAVNENLHIVGRLRCDANLRHLYKGPRKKGRGRPKTYDGKVDLRDVSRMELVGEIKKGVSLFTEVVNSVSLKRNIRIAYLLDTRKKKKKEPSHVVLFSTDTEIDARDIVRFYSSRYQIEFIFRDAKQFTGLCDCQAREKESLDFHFNASLSALNLARVEDQKSRPDDGPAVFSMSSHKTRYSNEFLIDRIISMSGIDPDMIKNHPDYEELRNLGSIAA